MFMVWKGQTDLNGTKSQQSNAKEELAFFPALTSASINAMQYIFGNKNTKEECSEEMNQ